MSGADRFPRPGAFDAEKALARLAHEMADPPFHDVLRPQPVRVDADGSVVIRLSFRPEFCGRRGLQFYHGGVIASLVDIAAHAAIAVRVERMVPTIDLRIDYLHTAPAGDLLATARILAVGRSIGRADVEIRSEDDKVVAVGRGAFSTRES
jgi:uncharacterized protein (TIGR00369 family)